MGLQYWLGWAGSRFYFDCCGGSAGPQESYIFSEIFFHLSMFEIHPNYLIRWIFSTLTFFLLVLTSSSRAAATAEPARLPARRALRAATARRHAPRAATFCLYSFNILKAKC